MLKNEIEKNKAIYEVNKALSNNYDTSGKELNLAGQNLRDLRFLPKMIREFNNLETLDLSNSDLRKKESVHQLCQMIDENDSIKHLVLRHCNINGNTLTEIADSLTKTKNENLTKLDIRDNPIQDEQYKVLFGMLQNNKTLLNVEYTLYE